MLSMKSAPSSQDLPRRIHQAVAHYWKTRFAQRKKQAKTGKADQGLRSAVTGGAQMDGFIDLFTDLIISTGIPEKYIYRNSDVELPGFFSHHQGMGSAGCP